MISKLSIGKIALVGAAAMLASTTAYSGPNFSYSTTNPAGSPNGGDITSINALYNPGTERLDWEYTTAPNPSGSVNDGFWLALSDGINPKRLPADSVAIFYGDLTNNLLTAYSYDGNNSPNSYQSQQYLQSWSGALNVATGTGGATQTTSFSVNVSGINAALNGSGASFGSRVGVWFHPSANSAFTYDANGGITNYGLTPGNAGYFDVSRHYATEVPEPASLALLSIGLIALAFSQAGTSRLRRWFARRKTNSKTVVPNLLTA